MGWVWVDPAQRNVHWAAGDSAGANCFSGGLCVEERRRPASGIQVSKRAAQRSRLSIDLAQSLLG